MSVVNYIKNKIDLIDFINTIDGVNLRKVGAHYRSACPICKGKNDTELVVNNRFFYCHRCHSGGNVIKFYQDYFNVPYSVAIKELALKLNFDIDNDKEYQEESRLVQSKEVFVSNCERRIEDVIDYLTHERCLLPSTIAEFRLGATERGSVVIPIHDLYGRVVSYCRRLFSGSAKYINDTNTTIYEKSSCLFNLNRALPRVTQSLYLCEGYFDAMCGHEQGLPIVAYSFAEVTKDQIKLLKNSCVNPETTMVICPDNDVAGLRHIKNVRKNFMEIAPRFLVKVLRMPEEEFEFCDPNKGTITHRKCKDLNDLHIQGIDISKLPLAHIDQFVLEQLINSNSDIQSQYNEVGEFIKSVSNPMIKADLAKYLSDYWNQDVSDIKKWFNVSDKDDRNSIVFKNASQSLTEMEEEAQIGYYSIGYDALDESLGGVRKKDVVMIGAYPSTGKTFVAGQYAHHCAVDLDLRVVFFSLEMPASALIERVGACHMNTSTDNMVKKAKEGNLSDVFKSVKKKLDKNLRIVDNSAVGFDDLDAIIKRANATEFDRPVDVVIIDYIQILSNIKSFEDLEYTAKRFKWLAKENNVIFVVLSQLARGTETWVRPVMSKLKGGGSLESSGDIILMLYKKGDDPCLSIQDKERLKNVVTCSIEKGRRGYNLKEIDLLIDKNTTTIRQM